MQIHAIGLVWAAAILAAVSLVMPNLDNDMRDGSITRGDSWPYQHLSGDAEWAKANNSLLIVTWDEDDNTARNQIPTVFYGANVKPGVYNPADQPLQRAVHAGADVRAAQTRLGRAGSGHHRHLGVIGGAANPTCRPRYAPGTPPAHPRYAPGVAGRIRADRKPTACVSRDSVGHPPTTSLSCAAWLLTSCPSACG